MDEGIQLNPCQKNSLQKTLFFLHIYLVLNHLVISEDISILQRRYKNCFRSEVQTLGMTFLYILNPLMEFLAPPLLKSQW